ncbi:hypothetical protein R3W88_007824 [Solanum pinnatisectum]|uniref:Aspartic peptidase DDI1-type domain-containing protein n=1 Tax=Solanum pinnatisectum TaxID=50273 RepID=A0AAV9M754_9SOLN|nr:hypothetical protein R3W88_007824 [Solanum pinnatisectum]
MADQAYAQNSRPQGGLLGNTDPNPKQVNKVGTRSGLQLDELAPKKRNTDVVSKKSEQKESEVVAQEERVQPIILSLLKQVHINLPLVDVLQGIPRYAKYVKEIVANKKRLREYETVALTKECSSRIQNNFPTKLKDSGSFTVQITIGQSIHARGLCDLGASINLIPTSLYKKLGLGNPKPTTIILRLIDL